MIGSLVSIAVGFVVLAVVFGVIERLFPAISKVIASPAFRRWHHTSAAEGRDRNFAGLLPLWDILFGTFWLPDRPPTRFGVDDPVPTHLPGQLLWPFRRDHGRFTIAR
jgi:sterol desaturase/sphingolipid hydroxylase (fatty acid hydroxylase superfamily)